MEISSSAFQTAGSRPHTMPYLVLRGRTKTDDHELLADSFQSAIVKARELGWIV
jgi:hypothetical protein